jgi:glycosyltransferase involved in cell wall biosynthesis
MNNKNVLLISYYFTPDTAVGAKRFSYLSKYMAGQGMTPYVLTIKEKYISPKDYSIHSAGIIHRTNSLPHYPFRWNKLSNIFKKICFVDQYIGWFIPAVVKCFTLLRKYKIRTVVVTGPPFSSFLIPYFHSFFFKFKFIIDYRDPWVLYSNPSSKIRRSINWFLEKIILNKADIIIFNTLKTKHEYCRIIPHIEKKSIIIPNGYMPNKQIEAKILEKNKRIIVYAGNFYGNRNINHLIDAIVRLSSEKMFELSLHIFGSLSDPDKEKLKLLNIPSSTVKEHKKVSYSELLQYLKGADILYISQNKDHEYSVPYKLIDYLSVKKPVLAVTSKNSATENILREVDCGEISFEDDPESIYCALKTILIAPEKYSFSGVEKYSFDKVANEFITLFS